MSSPGDGKEFVYSPVDVNATVFCAVSSKYLVWEVDGVTLDSPVEGLYQSGPPTYSDGVTESSVTIIGSRGKNHTRICCQSINMNGFKELHNNNHVR